MFDYQGFDYKAILENIMMKGGTEVYSDLKIMVLLGLVRGSNLTRMTIKMKEEGRNKVAELKNKYGLVQNAGISRDAITLPRIILCVPNIAMDILFNYPSITTLVMPDEICKDFPKCLCFQGSASVIPTSGAMRPLLYCVYKMNSIIATRIGKEKKIEAYFHNVRNFANTAHNSVRYGNLERLVLMRKYDIVDRGGKLRQSIVDAAANFLSVLKRKNVESSFDLDLSSLEHDQNDAEFLRLLSEANKKTDSRTRRNTNTQ